MQKKPITPYQVYSVAETANLIGMHPMSLRRKLAENNRVVDPFISRAQPVKIGKEWRFLGENILGAMGSVTYPGTQATPTTNNNDSAGAATNREVEK